MHQWSKLYRPYDTPPPRPSPPDVPFAKGQEDFLKAGAASARGKSSRDSDLGVSENGGVPDFGVLIVKILLFRVLY